MNKVLPVVVLIMVAVLVFARSSSNLPTKTYEFNTVTEMAELTFHQQSLVGNEYSTTENRKRAEYSKTQMHTLGANGWQLVSVSQYVEETQLSTSRHTTYFFQREVK